MQPPKAKEQSQDSRRKNTDKKTDLDNRYGKIGISAVAAAVRHKGEQRNTTETRYLPYDRD